MYKCTNFFFRICPIWVQEIYLKLMNDWLGDGQFRYLGKKGMISLLNQNTEAQKQLSQAVYVVRLILVLSHLNATAVFYLLTHPSWITTGEWLWHASGKVEETAGFGVQMQGWLCVETQQFYSSEHQLPLSSFHPEVMKTVQATIPIKGLVNLNMNLLISKLMSISWL